ncbi:hypothetical protein ACQY0O_006681 [Thecaphora frezii]
MPKGAIGDHFATMVPSSRLPLVHGSISNKGLDHRRSASDYSDAHKAKGRSPQKSMPQRDVLAEGDGEEVSEEDIEAALIRFQWIHETKRSLGPLPPALGRLAIPSSDDVETLSSPVLETAAKTALAKASQGKSRRTRSKSSGPSLRDVFTDGDPMHGKRQPERRASGRPPTDHRKGNSSTSLPSPMSTDSLDLGQFSFPPPPKTLRERHSHGSLRTAAAISAQKLVYPKEPSPSLHCRKGPPALPTRSPLRERRAKPPLHLVLDSKANAQRKPTTSSPDPGKSRGCGTHFSPPPCPPPAAPLPDLPTPSSEEGSFLFMHSRKASAASAPAESRRSSNSSDISYGSIGFGSGVGAKNFVQLRKQSFVRAHSASPSISKTILPGAGSLMTPPLSSVKSHFASGFASASTSVSSSSSSSTSVSLSSSSSTYSSVKRTQSYERVSSDDFFKLFDAVPLSPPSSARNSSDQDVSEKKKLENLVECLSPSMDQQGESGVFGIIRLDMLGSDAGCDVGIQATLDVAVAAGRREELKMVRRISEGLDLPPLGVEGEDKVVYGLAL